MGTELEPPFLLELEMKKKKNQMILCLDPLIKSRTTK